MDPSATYPCDICQKVCSRADSLLRHKRDVHNIVRSGLTGVNRISCPQHGCMRTFARQDNLNRHVMRVHGGATHGQPPPQFTCVHCGKGFARKYGLQRHEGIHLRKLALPGNQPAHLLVHHDPTTYLSDLRAADHHDRDDLRNDRSSLPQDSSLPRLEPFQRALRGAIISYKVKGHGSDPDTYLEGLVEPIERKITNTLKKQTGIKLAISLNVKFYKPTNPSETTDFNGNDNPYFWSKQAVVLRGDVASEKIRGLFPKIVQNIDQFTQKGSGWAVQDIMGLEIHFSKYKPFKGSSYAPLPPKLRFKHAVLNIINTDQKCFLWSILAHLHPLGRLQNANRATNYEPYEDELNCDGIQFPMKLTQIPKFERQNGISINVYGYEKDEGLHPLRISDLPGPHVGLIYFNGHYSLVRNLDSLLSNQRGGHRRKWFCHRCLFPFHSQNRLIQHLSLCGSHTKQTLSEKPSIRFENLQKIQRQPVVVYADFECLLEPIKSCSNKGSRPSTESYQLHTPCGFGLVESRSCCGAPEFRDPVIYRGEECVPRFLQELQIIAADYHERLNHAPGIQMSDEDNTTHLSDKCHICEKDINDPDNKVRDHCHICGRYRGPAHNECNQKYRLNRDITVVFHNLRRYDGHIVMKQIAQSCRLFGWQPTCIARAMEDYLGFRLHTPAERENGSPAWNVKFIDSAQFLSASLDSLVKALPREDFKALSDNFQDIDLLIRKGVYPYDHMDSWAKFQEPRLPPKEAFYSKLSKSAITDDDYEHATHIWHEFGILNMGMFHDHYLKSDTLQLADVVEKFRAVCLKNYGLDPMHYITLPSFAWDACLKLTKVELETIQDVDQYTFLEQGIRGGISVIMHRYHKANNPRCPEFDPEKPTDYIVYLDANNLYGWAMVQKLPVKGFHWVQDLQSVDWASTENGYIVEVDLQYPAHLHDLHNDYPLAPERMIPTELSAYQKSLQEELNVTSTGPKLIPNLYSKTKYICHVRNLQQYLQHGLVLTKVHRALAFEQAAWMEPYIMLNTQLRTAATTDFEKNLFKLMNNAVFGKTMENVREYKEVKLVCTEQQFVKLAAEPRYSRSCIFDTDFVGVMMHRKTVCLDKPIYVGFTVLDLSKTLMYDFHYRHMIPKYGDKAKLMFTDTDSFIYAIQTPDVYSDMLEDKDLFDTSDYPTSHPLHSLANKKVLGKMKDEMNGVPIWQFLGLRSKMYSFIDAEGNEKKKAKGIKKSVVKNEVKFSDYLESLNNHKKFLHSMNMIRSKEHNLFTITIRKTSLSPYDDKRYILEDGISTLAHGHTDIPLYELAEAMDWEQSA